MIWLTVAGFMLLLGIIVLMFAVDELRALQDYNQGQIDDLTIAVNKLEDDVKMCNLTRPRAQPEGKS